MDVNEKFAERIAELADWRGELMLKLRQLIETTAPQLKLEWKWGTSMWSGHGIVFGIAAFRDHVKLNFINGASLPDPKGIFNNGLASKTSRSIDFAKADRLTEPAIKAMIKAAVALDQKRSAG